jgi:hypothetical protein
MFFDKVVRNLKNGEASKAIKVCGSLQTGPIKINNKYLSDIGMVKLKVGYMSDVMLGKNIQVTLFNGENYDGGFILIKATPTTLPFYSTTYSDQTKLNDNVFSFILTPQIYYPQVAKILRNDCNILLNDFKKVQDSNNISSS